MPPPPPPLFFFSFFFFRWLITFGFIQRPDRIPCAFLHWAFQCELQHVFFDRTQQVAPGGDGYTAWFNTPSQGRVPTMVIALSVGAATTQLALGCPQNHPEVRRLEETSTPRRSAHLRDPLRLR
ncbi:hypothetical protein CGRA01v4_00648 [Colletotrichum graminicola]|nr:hypothetical protein CGRA01v4_00648 [Colletotrichum graminicola]